MTSRSARAIARAVASDCADADGDFLRPLNPEGWGWGIPRSGRITGGEMWRTRRGIPRGPRDQGGANKSTGAGGLMMMGDGAGRMQGGNATISLTNALEWAALLCAWTLRECAKVLPLAATTAEQEKTPRKLSDIWTRAAN